MDTSGPFVCPSCGQSASGLSTAGLTICGACGQCLVLAPDLRLATAADTTRLDPVTLDALRHASAAIRPRTA